MLYCRGSETRFCAPPIDVEIPNRIPTTGTLIIPTETQQRHSAGDWYCRDQSMNALADRHEQLFECVSICRTAWQPLRNLLTKHLDTHMHALTLLAKRS